MAGDEWQTPPELFAALDAHPYFGRFTLDVACTEAYREHVIRPGVSGRRAEAVESVIGAMVYDVRHQVERE